MWQQMAFDSDLWLSLAICFLDFAGYDHLIISMLYFYCLGGDLAELFYYLPHYWCNSLDSVYLVKH